MIPPTEPFDETPPEAPAHGKEEAFVTAFQAAHPEFAITDIRKALRHCSLELALDQLEEPLMAAVEEALGVEHQPIHSP